MFSTKRNREYKESPAKYRMMAKVSVTDSCWLFTGGLNNKGYGMLGVGSKADGTRKPMLVHRISYEAFIGPLSKTDVVMHTCDTPSCVNPLHLVAGTQKDNVADMCRKGRAAMGEKAGNAVLTDELVKQARAERTGARGEVTRLSKKFGVLRETLGAALRGATWSHVK